VWRVWIEAAIAAADSTSQPQVVLAVWRRAEAALRAESAPLKVLLAEWLCRLNLSRARELRPALLRSPPTPLRVYEALLAHESAEGPLYGKSVLQGSSADLAGQSGGVSARCVAAELVALFERAVLALQMLRPLRRSLTRTLFLRLAPTSLPMHAGV